MLPDPLHELNRLEKEQGKKSGGSKDKALNFVRNKIRKETGRPEGQRKKVKGAKSTAGTGKYKRAADEQKQLKKDAKEMGYGSDTKGYVETRARYGSKENMKSGRGLGT